MKGDPSYMLPPSTPPFRTLLRILRKFQLADPVVRQVSANTLTYPHTHTLSLSLSHTHTHTHALSLSHTHTQQHTHTRTCRRTYASLSLLHTQTRTHTYTRTHTHIHTHTHKLFLRFMCFTSLTFVMSCCVKSYVINGFLMEKDLHTCHLADLAVC